LHLLTARFERDRVSDLERDSRRKTHSTPASAST
jgi:hypothetical protein